MAYADFPRLLLSHTIEVPTNNMSGCQMMLHLIGRTIMPKKSEAKPKRRASARGKAKAAAKAKANAQQSKKK